MSKILTSVKEENGELKIWNRFIKIVYDLKSGEYNFINSLNKTVIMKALSTIVLSGNLKCSTSEYPKKEWEKKTIVDKIGKGMRLEIKHSGLDQRPDLILSFTLYDEFPFCIMRVYAMNNTEWELRVDRFEVLKVLYEQGGKLNLESNLPNWRFYRNGVISFSPTCSLGIDKEGMFESIWIGAIKNKKTGNFIVTGFVTLKDQYSKILLDVANIKDEKYDFMAISYAEGYKISPGNNLSSEKLFISFSGSALSGLEDWATVVKHEMNAVPWDHTPLGLCTWYYYHLNISEGEVVKIVDFFAKNRDMFPIEYVQIDCGFYSHIGDWIELTEKFPHGMRWLAEKIRKVGFKPGIWIAPFWVGSRSSLYKAHPDWIVRDKDGKPVIIISAEDYKTLFYAELPEEIYCLDTTKLEVLAWLKQLFKTLVDGWGYEYLKIDFLHSPLTAAEKGGIFSNRNATGVQACRLGLEAIREAADGKYILGCGAPIGPTVGIVNAIRIGNDTAAFWGEKSAIDTYNQPGVVNEIRNIMARYFMHGKLWINDPDCLLVRDIDGLELSLDEARSLATAIALSGGAMMLSDKMYDLSQIGLEIYSKVIPPYGKSARAIDLFEHEIPTIFDLIIEKTFDTWHVVGVFNTSDEEENITIKLKDLGLNEGKGYHVFDFWEEKYYGQVSNEILLKKMKPHSCKLLAIRSVLDVPQLISTTLHFTQGGLEVEDVHFDETTLKLTTRLTFKGKRNCRVFFYVPDIFKISNVTSNALKCKMSPIEKNLIAVELTFKDTSEITINFSKK